MDPADTVTVFVTLFVVMDPIGPAPLSVAPASGMAPARSQQFARKALTMAAGLLARLMPAGNSILRGIGIPILALRSAGGMRLAALAVRFIPARPAQAGLFV